MDSVDKHYQIVSNAQSLMPMMIPKQSQQASSQPSLSSSMLKLTDNGAALKTDQQHKKLSSKL